MSYHISGSALKMIAIITMTIDHIASHLLRDSKAFMEPLFVYHNTIYDWYFLLRCIGRLAFPIFAFLIVQGFIHTSNKRRYGINLLVCALISETPWALLHKGFHLMGHNVVFTLLLGYLGLCAIERYRDDRRKIGIILIGMLCFAFIFRAEYNSVGFAFIIMLYALRRHKALQAIIGFCMLPKGLFAGMAFIPINMYNGKRGFIRGAVSKYLFYAFYPAHLLIIHLVRCWL